MRHLFPRILLSAFLALIAGLSIIGLAACGESSQAGHPQGIAEDLWGNKIDLSEYREGPVFFQPFSPSNCGYCLVDGNFVSENYYHNTERYGGEFFHQCLFNPQLDVYSFLKHYRDDAPVITGPTSLHAYHDDGFPFIIAFNNGKVTYSGGLTPYEEIFDSLRFLFWKSDSIPLYPTSDFGMGEYMTNNNHSMLGIIVLSDGDSESIQEFDRRKEEIRQLNRERGRDYFEGTRAVYESQLVESDWRKNLLFYGYFHKFDLSILEGTGTPIKIGRDRILVGEYSFPKDDVGVIACFPNPFNPRHYISIKLFGRNIKTGLNERHVDFAVYRDGPDGKPEILIHGLFAKDGHRWEFSPLWSCVSEAAGKFCEGGKCPAPATSSGYDRDSKRKGAKIPVSSSESQDGNRWTIGGKSCRFPSLMVDRDGTAWVAWEEQGDIILSSVNKSGNQTTIEVENDGSDSFNPLQAEDSNDHWIFYLNDKRGFYHIYGVALNGAELSEPILFSENEPCDVITPAVAYDDGRIILAWTQWKTNYRHLKYREIINRIPREIETVQIKMSENKEINAWYPSLAYGPDGDVRGCWNQHKPAILGVYAGDLVHEAGVVIPDNEFGGYPSITIDDTGTSWVAWETFMWNYAWNGTPQSINVAYYDRDEGRWSLPYKISSDSLSVLNQTPEIDVDENGNLWVVWSGRKSEDHPWNIFMAKYENGTWSSPEIISPPGENARAPQICAGTDNDLWIAWHSGVGDEMKIKVLNYRP